MGRYTELMEQRLRENREMIEDLEKRQDLIWYFEKVKASLVGAASVDIYDSFTYIYPKEGCTKEIIMISLVDLAPKHFGVTDMRSEGIRLMLDVLDRHTQMDMSVSIWPEKLAGCTVERTEEYSKTTKYTVRCE